MASSALFLLICFPLVGAGFAALMKPVSLARAWALVVSFLCFACAMVVAVSLTAGTTVTWGIEGTNPISIPEIGFGLKLSCDAISLWMVVLTTLIVPLVILSIGKKINEQDSARWYYAWILLLLGGLIGTFLAADALLFYFFFELTLIPSLLLISIWGGDERRSAAMKFFIYTFAGSIFLLISIIYLAAQAGSFLISDIVRYAHADATQREIWWCGIGLLIGFLIKTPVFPLHTWQPLTYAESPEGANAIFASVLGKLGTYGLLRLTLPIAFTAFATSSHNQLIVKVVVVLCLVSIVYGGLIAWVQKDMVRVMAYSSLSHLGLCVLAIFAATTLSLQGAVVYMIAHGLSTAALFMVIQMIAQRTGTRNMDEMSGLFAKMPILSSLMVIFVMASIGLPITSGFVGEFLSLQGVMGAFGLTVTIIASTGMVLGAIYMLHMVAKVGFGPYKVPDGVSVTDVNVREMTALAPLVVAVFLLGVMPTPVLDSIKPDVMSIKSWEPKKAIQVGPAQNEEVFFGQ